MHIILQEDSRHAQYITRGRETYCSSARAYYSNFIIRLLSLSLHTPLLIGLGPVFISRSTTDTKPNCCLGQNGTLCQRDMQPALPIERACIQNRQLCMNPLYPPIVSHL